MIMDDNYGQMMFGDLGGLKLPDICLTGEEKPRKNLIQETCPDRGSNPDPLRDRRACYHLVHSGGRETFRSAVTVSFITFSFIIFQSLNKVYYQKKYKNFVKCITVIFKNIYVGPPKVFTFPLVPLFKKFAHHCSKQLYLT